MGSNMDMHDLSILSAEEHSDLRILEERERARRMQAHQSDQPMSRPDGPGESKGRGAGRGRKRAESDDSGHDPMPVARGGPGNSSNRKQRGRPRLDTKDENAADVCHTPPPLNPSLNPPPNNFQPFLTLF